MRTRRQRSLRTTLALTLVHCLASVAGPLAPPASAAGSVSLTTLGVAYTENFDTLASTGTSSTVPLGWDFAETGTNANTIYTAGNGGIATGDTYSIGTSGDSERAFGGLQSGSLNPTIGAQFTNNTGAAINSLAISYTGEQWRAGVANRGAADRIDFQYSTDATSLTTGTWTDHDPLDFASPNTSAAVGALLGNAANNSAPVTATISGLTIAAGATFWIRWTDFNIASSDDGLGIDDFSLTASAAPPALTLSVGDVSANEGDSGVTAFDFTVSLSAPAGPGGVSFDIATADGTATAPADYTTKALTGQTIAAGASNATFRVDVHGDTTFEPDDTFFVNVTNVTGAVVGDGQGQGTIRNDDANITRIHAIQGSGDTAASGTFTIEAIVVGDYQTQGSGQLRGFFVQEEDVDADADPATSEGIFVFCATCPTAVSVGDRVRVTGSSSEFFNMSQLSATTAASVVVVSPANPLPTPATIELPVPGVPSGDLAAATAAINAYFERAEGMLVTFPDALSVAEYFELARYGQVVLTEGGRPRQFTDTNLPTAAGLVEHTINRAARTIILDDTDNRQNRPVDTPNTNYYHPVPGLSTGNFFRGGDTITNLTGVLHWSFAGQTGTDRWRIRPVTERHTYTFTSMNARPGAPSVGGSLKVASFNVLNYFLTVDTTASNDVGTCGPSSTLDCRGADSAAELQRQRDKLTQALLGLNADIVGLIEMENTPNVDPAAQIVADLNAVAGAGTFARLDTGVIGTDAIRVGLLYKPAKVQLVGSYEILDASVDPDFDSSRNRPALAQTFLETATGGRLTVVVNHLKSKGSGCGLPDDDLTTGQGNCNGTRTRAAQALADWLATDPTGSGDADVLIVGDLNSYAKEDPITALRNAGYTDLLAQFGGSGAYSYVFDGQLGYLDHALSNASLTPQVAGAAEWHINADEIPLFDYNDAVRDAGEASFEEESDTQPLYAADPYRTSDHDPIVIGLNLVNAAPELGTITVSAPSPVPVGTTVTASAPFTDADKLDTHTAVWSWGDGSTSAGSVTEAGGSGTIAGSHTYAAPGVYTVTVTVDDGFGHTDVATYEYIVVYDASVRVTGGGWIESPAGKGHFTINTRYQRDAGAPSGSADFRLNDDRFRLRAASFEWLVVSGAEVQLKGTGTVNGEAGYGFWVTAVDGSPDAYRIRIWRLAGGEVVYDNGAPLALGGGSIVIHR